MDQLAQLTLITEVQIKPIKAKDGLIAFASVIFNNSIYLGSIGIHTRLDGVGYRLTYPKKNQFHIFHPINKQTSQKIEEAILHKLSQLNILF